MLHKKRLGLFIPVFLMFLMAVVMFGFHTLQAHAVNNGLALTPPMGWNNYNHFGCNVGRLCSLIVTRPHPISRSTGATLVSLVAPAYVISGHIATSVHSTGAIQRTLPGMEWSCSKFLLAAAVDQHRHQHLSSLLPPK